MPEYDSQWNPVDRSASAATNNSPSWQPPGSPPRPSGRITTPLPAEPFSPSAAPLFPSQPDAMDRRLPAAPPAPPPRRGSGVWLLGALVLLVLVAGGIGGSVIAWTAMRMGSLTPVVRDVPIVVASSPVATT